MLQVSKFKFLLVAFLIAGCSAIHPFVLPPGWRLPHSSEVNQEWRNENSARYLSVTADFDTDGISDEAAILVNEEEAAIGLFLLDGKQQRALLLDKQPLLAIESMGILAAQPGEYLTACGKGYWPCSAEEPPKLTLNATGIHFFKIESADSIFYWDSLGGRFKRAWISD